MSSTPTNPTTRNAAARRLAEVLRAENDLLGTGDPTGAARLLPEKQSATQALQTALLDGAADPQWAYLLRELANENRARLTQAIEVQGRIVEMVARAARAAAPSPVRYGARGKMRSPIGAIAMALRA